MSRQTQALIRKADGLATVYMHLAPLSGHFMYSLSFAPFGFPSPKYCLLSFTLSHSTV